MHLHVLQENLKAALATVMPAVSKNGLLILETVRLTAKGSRLTLVATNLTLTIMTSCGAKIEQEGVCCVPAKLLQELVGGLVNDRVSLQLKDRELTIGCASAAATLTTADADDYPTIAEPVATTTIPIALIRDAAALVAPAAATDDTRPALRGVHVTLGLRAVCEGADGYRLARLVQPLERPDDDRSAYALLIPATSLLAAAKALKGLEQDTVQIGTFDGAPDAMGTSAPAGFVIDAGGLQIQTRLIEGQFPDIDRVIPETFKTRAVLETDQGQKAVVIAAVFAKRSSGVVKIAVEPSPHDLGVGRITLSANAAEVGSSVVTLDAMVAGPAAQIALHSTYLAAALESMATPQTALELNQSTNPAVFRPVGTDGYVHVVMPMTVR